VTAYYEEIMELWKAGKFFDAIRYFSRWILKGLVSEEESKGFGKDLVKFWELLDRMRKK